MAKISTDIDIDETLLRQANTLLRRINHPVLPYHVDDVGLEHFVALYETITQETIPGSKSARTMRDKVNICQFLIDSLADDIFGVTLDHITGYKIVTGNRKCISDLLDIFSVLIEYDENNKEKSVDENNNDSVEILPTPMRELLTDLKENAVYLVKSVPVCRNSLKEARNVKTEFTQTTPVCMTSSTTSPILDYRIWSDLLDRSRRVNTGVKGKTEVEDDSVDHPKKINPPASTKNKTKSSVIIYTYPSSSHKPGLRKVPKPKPVLSTKIRRKSSSLGPPEPPKRRLGSNASIKSKAPLTKSFRVSKRGVSSSEQDSTKTNLNHVIKLLDDAEKIRCRRREIAKCIRQLEDEEKRLKTVEAILMKEIKFAQQIRARSRLARSTRIY